MKQLPILLLSMILFFGCTKDVPEDVVDEYIIPPQSVVDKQFNFHLVDSNVWRLLNLIMNQLYE